ncbi:cupin domain-containing protein [Psychromonas sp. SA13A]|uniref:cupin domain-containing protein n=1 Tax=Psychromonas sp. SA13A TaxID=2686346 RepID=UPI001407A6BC|nr:cupin domain-containing protein [Psychromonas sp. SA13A]
MKKIYPYFINKDERGVIKGICNHLKIEEINFVKSEANIIRGGHYHKDTQELFYIINGEVEVEIQDLKGNVLSSDRFISGDIFVIEPYELHTFKVLVQSCWINALTKKFSLDSPDIYQLNKK